MASPYDRFVTTATRQIKKWGDPCVWQSIVSGTLVDPNEPWKNPEDIIVKTNVHILFKSDDLEDRQLRHYLKNIETQRGLVNGKMHVVNFVPTLKDTVIRNGVEYTIAALDTLKPGSVIILHRIEFKF